MRFQPVQQLQTVFKREYYEPTIAWSFRVVLALNVPLIFVPLYLGAFKYEVVWMAFAAYMLALVDYRGLHYRKVVIQSIEAVLITIAAIVGMNISNTWFAAVLAMMVVGMFVALIRNWSDYGAAVGVGVGFFFLFGLANPCDYQTSLHIGMYVLAGALWSIIITVLSFPFRPSNPIRRSVAKIWKSNTEYLDVLIQKHCTDVLINDIQITQKETAIRTAVNQSIDLFSRRDNRKSRLTTQHYDMMMEIRRTSSLYTAALHTMHEELSSIHHDSFKEIKRSVLYKLLSAFAQTSARLSVLMFTFRAEEFTMVNVKAKRCEIAIDLFEESCKQLQTNEQDAIKIKHLISTIKKAHEYLTLTIKQVEQKLNLRKSDYLENYKLSLNNFLIGLKPRVIKELINEAFNINSQHFIYAIRVAIGLSVGVFLFRFFEIDHGYWISLTMLIVIQPYFGATKKKGIERIIGTVAGILLGGVIMLLPLPHEVFVGMLIVVSFFVAYFLRNNYKIGVFFVTVMMVVLMQMSQLGTWQLIGWRVLSTLLGAALAIASSYVFWPTWEKNRFPDLMKKAILNNKMYLEKVLQYYNHTENLGDSWNKQRRLTEASNNEVFASVQRMVEEPEKVQHHVDLNFTMAGVSIRLTREITSIALSVTSSTHRVLKLDDYFKQVSSVFDWITLHIHNPSITYSMPNFIQLKSTISQLPTLQDDVESQFVKSELEKILFELETLCVLIKEKKYS